MKPSIKLHSIAFGLATALVFSAWIFISEFKNINPYLSILIGGLISIGIYRLVANFIIYLTIKSSWIKKMFMGSYYLEGTWIGFYIGSSGQVRYIIEKFEQDIDKLVIRGISYNEDFGYHAAWFSTSANIDVESGIVSYMYDCVPINDKSNGNGIAKFTFERENQYSAANGLIGFSADLHIGQRCKARERKLKDANKKGTSEILLEAKAFFELNRSSF